MKKIMVTGGAGFIGSHLCKELLIKGHHVICVDNFHTGDVRNIEEHIRCSKFQVMNQDITYPFYVAVDEIYNLACPASPKYYQENPVETIRTNVIGMANVLEIAKRAGAKVVQASTSEVYGCPQEHPQKETYWGNVNCVGPRSMYDEGKRCAESLCREYKIQHDVDVRIVRIFNTYGPNMAIGDGRVVSNFIVAALADRDIKIYGNGEQTRSFCYVDDTVRGLMLMMGRGPTEKEPFIVNIGNPEEEIRIIDLARMIKRMIKTVKQCNIVYEADLQDDPIMRKPDIGKAQRMGWEPLVRLENGLKETIAYFSGVVR